MPATRAARRATAQAFLTANVQDWGDGPMRDVMAGLDALIADGLVDGDRMGVTGGSYGGYLTSWIVGHTDRFKAAVTCRSVNDMISQMLSGDIGGPDFGLLEYGVHPWEDWDLYRAPLAADVRDRGDAPRSSSSTPRRTCAARSPRPRSCSPSSARCARPCA